MKTREPLNKLKEIFDILNLEYNATGDFSDNKFMIKIDEGSGMLKEDKNIKDFYFILNLCYGPWREGRQKEVWDFSYNIFKEKYNGDLRNIDNATNMGLPLRWQIDRVNTMKEYLLKNNVSFNEFIASLDNKTGLEVRNTFKKLFGSTQTKTISTFIRDILNKDVFPIDSRVRNLLSYLGLPNSEDMMVYLSRKMGINPREYERMLYYHYGMKCDKKACKKCILNSKCYYPVYIEAIFDVDVK